MGRGLEVVFFDVGQGDAIFVETSEGHQVLIDGGPNGEVILEKLSGAMPFWDRTLDLIVLTHSDYDHLRGLNDVLLKYKVKNILWTGGEKESKTFGYWLEALEREKKQGAKVFLAQAGQIVKMGEARLYVLYPKEPLAGQSVEKWSNDSSIVSKLVFGQSDFLLLGDISRKIEKQLLLTSALPVSLASEVIKAAHHGSKQSSSKEFFEVVRPDIAVISCGRDNSYGHPHQETLRTLQEFAITILRTDELGDIKLTSDSQVIYNEAHPR